MTLLESRNKWFKLIHATCPLRKCSRDSSDASLWVAPRRHWVLVSQLVWVPPQQKVKPGLKYWACYTDRFIGKDFPPSQHERGLAPQEKWQTWTDWSRKVRYMWLPDCGHRISDLFMLCGYTAYGMYNIVIHQYMKEFLFRNFTFCVLMR
jgi:hypothetical protein